LREPPERCEEGVADDESLEHAVDLRLAEDCVHVERSDLLCRLRVVVRGGQIVLSEPMQRGHGFGQQLASRAAPGRVYGSPGKLIASAYSAGRRSRPACGGLR
jgi:hypothetical protein